MPGPIILLHMNFSSILHTIALVLFETTGVGVFHGLYVACQELKGPDKVSII
jgi:hypothetical protein